MIGQIHFSSTYGTFTINNRLLKIGEWLEVYVYNFDRCEFEWVRCSVDMVTVSDGEYGSHEEWELKGLKVESYIGLWARVW